MRKFIIGDIVIDASDSWNGPDGYKFVYVKDHPRAKRRNGMYEHILVMEQELGRFLFSGEVIHHIDGNKSNNNLENLMLFSSDGDHREFHNFMTKIRVCKNIDYVRCGICKKYFDPDEEGMYSYGKGYEHKKCRIAKSSRNRDNRKFLRLMGVI